MPDDMKVDTQDSDAVNSGEAIAKIRDAIKGKSLTEKEREELLAEAEAMGKELTMWGGGTSGSVV